MPKHTLQNDVVPAVSKEPTIEELQSRYKRLTEGADLAPMMGGGDIGGGPGAIMPPPAIAPPIVPAGGVPGATGDAALSPPPNIKDLNSEDPKDKKPEDKEDKKEMKGIKRLLRTVRENLLEIEMRLREMGALEEDEEEGEESKG